MELLLWFFVGYEIIRAIKKRRFLYNIFVLPPPFIYFLLINYLLLLEVISSSIIYNNNNNHKSWKSCIVVIEIYFRTVSLENVFEEKARKHAIDYTFVVLLLLDSNKFIHYQREQLVCFKLHNILGR